MNQYCARKFHLRVQRAMPMLIFTKMSDGCMHHTSELNVPQCMPLQWRIATKTFIRIACGNTQEVTKKEWSVWGFEWQWVVATGLHSSLLCTLLAGGFRLMISYTLDQCTYGVEYQWKLSGTSYKIGGNVHAQRARIFDTPNRGSRCLQVLKVHKVGQASRKGTI